MEQVVLLELMEPMVRVALPVLQEMVHQVLQEMVHQVLLAPQEKPVLREHQELMEPQEQAVMMAQAEHLE
jgi:hypothetical protein